MKRNIVLAIIFLLLLLFTYFFEEKRISKDLSSKEEMAKLFTTDKLGSLTGFETENIKISQKGNKSFAANGYPIDPKKLELLYETLSRIKAKRLLDKNEITEKNRSHFFPDKKQQLTFNFEKGNITFILGQKLELDRSFYMEVTNQGVTSQVIAYDDSADQEIVSENRSFNTSEKYDQLRTIFNLKEDYFYNTLVFKDQTFEEFKNTWQKAVISNIRNRPVTINFNMQTTDPVIPAGLQYNKDSFITFLKNIFSLEPLSINFPYNKSLLQDKISSITLTSPDSKTITLSLFRKYGPLSGNYLTTSFDQTLYEFNQQSLQSFFLNMQDFWDKSVFPKETIFERSGLAFRMASYDFIIPKGNNFEVTSTRASRINNQNFKKLFELLTQQADMISLEGSAISSPDLSLEFPEFSLQILYKNNEIIIIRPKNKIRYHFFIGADAPIPLNLVDYFL